MRVTVARLFTGDHISREDYQVSRILGHQVVTGRHYIDGQIGVYIGVGCIVPEDILREMWLWNDHDERGRLGGRKGNRVKAKLMDGVMSEGLFYGYMWYDACGVWHIGRRFQDNWQEGQEVHVEMGITLPTAGA